jgi:hypothetical protein
LPDLAGLFDELLVTEPGLPALVQDGHVTTFGDWRNDSAVIASALAERGVGPGDMVVLMLPSGQDFASCYLAALWAIPTWEQWAAVEQSLATGKEDVLLPDSRDAIETRQRILLADAPLCPFMTGRQPSRDDRTD